MVARNNHIDNVMDYSSFLLLSLPTHLHLSTIYSLIIDRCIQEVDGYKKVVPQWSSTAVLGGITDLRDVSFQLNTLTHTSINNLM